MVRTGATNIVLATIIFGNTKQGESLIENLSQNYLNFFLPQFSLSSESLKIAIRYEEAGSNIQSLHKHIMHSNTP
jgi:hypothetical protein